MPANCSYNSLQKCEDRYCNRTQSPTIKGGYAGKPNNTSLHAVIQPKANAGLSVQASNHALCPLGSLYKISNCFIPNYVYWINPPCNEMLRFHNQGCLGVGQSEKKMKCFLLFLPVQVGF